MFQICRIYMGANFLAGSLLKFLLWIEFDGRRVEYDQKAARENEQRLEGIRSIHHKPSEWIYRGAPIRGRRVEMEMDEESFAGEGDMFLFASILDNFFALYSTVNSFTQLQVKGTGRGEVYTWDRRLGRQIVL